MCLKEYCQVDIGSDLKMCLKDGGGGGEIK